MGVYEFCAPVDNPPCCLSLSPPALAFERQSDLFCELPPPLADFATVDAGLFLYVGIELPAEPRANQPAAVLPRAPGTVAG